MNKPLCLPATISIIRPRLQPPKQSTSSVGKTKETYLMDVDEWITLPLAYSSLPLSTQLAISIWITDGPRKQKPVAGTTFKLFAKHKTVREAQYRLHLYPNQEGDGREDSVTPSKLDTHTEVDRLDKIIRKYERGDLPKVDWLDELVFKEIANTKQVRKRCNCINIS